MSVVVDRLLEQLPALNHYFLETLPTENPLEYRNNERVASIKAALRDPVLRIELHFLKNVLPLLNKFEKLYQRESVLIHK
jgi:hypothetical protein